jgi:hypothetical protein
MYQQRLSAGARAFIFIFILFSFLFFSFDIYQQHLSAGARARAACYKISKKVNIYTYIRMIHTYIHTYII